MSEITGDAFGRFRSVQVQVGKPKFMGGEHQWLGREGMVAACAEAGVPKSPYSRIRRANDDERFSYGELVALSGDFYGSPADLYDAKPALLPWLYEANDLSDLKAVFREEIDWIEDENRAASVGYPDNTIALAWNAKSYIELALDNADHFGWHNAVAYCRHHTDALELARQADPNDDNDRRWRRALFTNAFADHFLTDGFAAGHVRVPRAEIQTWGDEIGNSRKLSGALSKLLHDQDGHIGTLHSNGESALEDEGLAVRNSLGVDWRTRCDGQLFIVHPDGGTHIAEPVAAVKESVLELFRARTDDVLPQDTFAATRHLPFPHPDAPSLCEKFPSSMDRARLDALMESVAWYMKIPWISTGIDRSSVHALFYALPALMGRMRQNVSDAVEKTPELARRLPAAYIDAFRLIS